MQEDIDAIVGDRFKALQKNLKKPLIFFDTETTGVSPNNDRIVEITIVKITKKKVYDPLVVRMNPEMPIPEGASKVHGIYDEDVKECKTFANHAKSLAKVFEGADYAGYNVQKYDIPLLQAEFNRVGVKIDLSKGNIVDPFLIFKQKMRQDLISALRFYAGKELTEAHSSLADTLAAVEVLSQQLEFHEDLPIEVGELSADKIRKSSGKDKDGENRHFDTKDGKYFFKFGKHKGKRIDDPTAQSYLKWMLKQKPPNEFPDETVNIIMEHFKKKAA